MLDRTKVIQEIENVSAKIFTSNENQTDLAFEKWQEILQAPTFKKRVIESESSFLLPDWQQDFNQIIKINPEFKNYAVLASDGSQIYPERHISGINCVLLNIGHCLLEYADNSLAILTSAPQVLTTDQVIPGVEEAFSVDLVDLKREEFELKSALEKSIQLFQNYRQCNLPFTVLFDGSLVFWQLEAKSSAVKKYFLNEYIQALDGFYQHNIPMASYISMSKSRELVNLTKIGFCRFERANCISCHSLYQDFPCKAVDNVLDAHLCSRFLNEFERTIVFQSKSKIVDIYPAHLKPCFLYINVGHEIARLEFPFWVSQNSDHLNLICKTAIDQSIKGNGYPVALAEAHEQAIIRSADRDFFYHMLNKKSLSLKQRIVMSQKSLKKYNSVF
ncbi:MAG: NurA nuclease domain protein [candidate division TM6 bacterium GW2011_GWF2_37_49]|nr:MAG: NurA nuclease domain protein [candidate division TM6 bacterium GW2011_GWF2_37_49]